MKARLADPGIGSPAPQATRSATVPSLASVIGNRAMREAVAGTTVLGRPSLPPAVAVQLKLSTGRAPGGPGSHVARVHGSGLGAAAVHAAAARGVATSWSALPHAGLIQRSFGRHAISSVRAHVGDAAAASAAEMGADAYATGNHVVLGKGTDLFTVAHEATHVIQQRGGVQLKGGVGEASDAYEQHANEVALLVVQGKSAEALLGARAPSPVSTSAAAGPVQRQLRIGSEGEEQRILPEVIREHVLDTNGGNEVSVEALIMMANSGDIYRFPTWEEAVISTNGQTSVQELLTYDYWMDQLTQQDPEAFKESQKPSYWRGYDKKKKNDDEPRQRTLINIATEVGPALLMRLQRAAETDPRQLKLYRTMDKKEADAIRKWYADEKQATENLVQSKTTVSSSELSKTLKDKESPRVLPIRGHVGDRAQAMSYHNTGKVVLEFTLKPGAHQLLFDPDYLAMARSGRGASSVIAENEKRARGRVFPAGSVSEGNLAGYIGLKSENRGDFSLTMGVSEPTHLLFQLFIDSIKVERDASE